MRRLSTIFISLFLTFTVSAQVVFKTELDRKRVPVGESFLVQYLLEDVDRNDGFTPPFFRDFRLVSGPRVYEGSVNTVDGPKAIKNISFTLEAVKTGRFIIPGASARVNGKFIKSDEQVIEVISKAEYLEGEMKAGDEQASDYFLRPGEDPYDKIRRNLFMKVLVDKKSCYIGEPVVATFKLYSRLESRSDIVKNPGFYGFAVQDMVGLNDRMSSIETVHGKVFDVHTVRKVQLYPLQPGVFKIDAMEVLNKVEFSRSVVNKKTEQEIVEGVLHNDEHSADENTVTYENSISTEDIPINVKDYPEKNKPASFGGATGRFKIHAELKKQELARNETGELVVTIEGRGNLTQLVPPPIQWPTGLEGFDPAVADELDKSQAPLVGKRIFHFPFVASKPGNYVLPAVSLSMFDPDTNTYKTVSSAPISLKIDARDHRGSTVEATRPMVTKQSRLLWIALSLAVALAVLLWVYISKRKKVAPSNVEYHEGPAIEELLLPAEFALKANDNQFYKLLQNSIRDFLMHKLQSGEMQPSRSRLSALMNERNFPSTASADLIEVLQQCETALFTRSAIAAHKEELLKKARKAMETIQRA